jgi:hypothetical protein
VPRSIRSTATLAWLRARAAEQAARSVADALRRLETAARASEDAEREQGVHAGRAGTVRRDEHEALARGERTGAHLWSVDGWGAHIDVEAARLAARLSSARAAEDEARRGEGAAQRTLAARAADAAVVEKLLARRLAEAKRAAEGREEEAAAEAWRRPGDG